MAQNKKTKEEIETLKTVNTLKKELFTPRLEAALSSTLCFFHDDEDGNPAAYGSGVFIEYKGEYFIISAAHVLAENYNELFLILKDKELKVGGSLYNSPMPVSGVRDDDKIDISVLKVDEVSKIELLRNFVPLNIGEIEVSHKIQEFGTYFSLGFPVSKTKKLWGKNEIKSTAFSYQSQIIPNYDFEKDGFHESTTIALKFDGKVTSSSNPYTHKAPQLYGVSGSGLWRFFEKDKKSLVGIMIEKETGSGAKAVLATRIDVVIKIIEDSL